MPTLGWIKLKEKGYVPTKGIVSSGTISQKAGRYFVSVLIKEDESRQDEKLFLNGIGIDLGLKD